jgi:hypothetical protein
MALSNFSRKLDAIPARLSANEFILNMVVASGTNQCKPKHCGVCGECRQKKWQPVGEIGGDLTGDDYLDYQGAGWIVSGFDPSDPSNPYTAFYSGPVYNTQAEALAACPDGECVSPDGSADLVVDAAYFPLSFIRNETECAQHSASLPAGQSCQWFTTANTTNQYVSGPL